MKRSSVSRIVTATLVAMALSLLQNEALAQASWTGLQPSLNWNDVNNWIPTSLPANDVSLIFNADTANSEWGPINTGGNHQPGKMTFAAATTAQGFSFVNNQLNLNNAGGIENQDDQAQVFASNINLLQSMTFKTTDPAGTIVLNGTLNDNNNTQTLTINSTGGAISLSRASDGGAVAGLTMTAGQFNLACPTFAVDQYALQGAGGTLDLTYGTGGCTLTVVQGNAAATLATTLAGNGNIIKQGTGTLTLTGNNTRTGYFNLQDGSLTIDFSANNNADSKLSSTAPLYMGGTGRNSPVFTMNGNAGAPSSQTVNGLALSAGVAASIAVTSAGGQSATLNLGAITRALGGTLTINLPASGNVTTSSANTNGIAPACIALGDNWATAAAGSGNLGSFSAYNTKNDVTTWTLPDNIDNSAAFSGTIVTQRINSLRFAAAVPSAVNITGRLTIGTGGLLVSSGVGANLSQITGGKLISDNGSGDLVVIQNNTAGALTIGSAMSDVTGITTMGAGTLNFGSGTGDLALKHFAVTGTGSVNFSAGQQVTLKQTLANVILGTIDGSGSPNLIKTRSGTLTFTGSSGKIGSGIATLTLNKGTLQLTDVAGSGVNNRIDSGVSVNMGGGVLQYNGQYDHSQVFTTPLTLKAGASRIYTTRLGTGTANPFLKFDNMTHEKAGSVSFNLSNSEVRFNGNPGAGNPGNCIPYGFIMSGTIAKIDTSSNNRIIAMPWGGACYPNVWSASTSTNVVTMASMTAVQGTLANDAMIYAFRNATSTAIALNGFNLNVVGGTIVSTYNGGNTISGAGRLTAGGNNSAGGELRFSSDMGGRSMTISANITDNAGDDGIYGNADDGPVYVVDAADPSTGTFTIGGNNTHTGGTYLNGDSITMQIGSVKSIGRGPMVVNGQSSSLNLTANGVWTNTFIFNADCTVGGNQNANTFTNNIILNNECLVAFGNYNSSGTPLRYYKAITGTGGIRFIGRSYQYIQGADANTFSGKSYVQGTDPGYPYACYVYLQKAAGVTAIGGDIEIGYTYAATASQYTDYLYLGNHEQIADTATVSFRQGCGTNAALSVAGNDAGCFSMQGYNETIAGLASVGVDGVVEDGAAGKSILTLAPIAERCFSFAGLIRNGGSGKLHLVINGKGTQILSAPNTYTGGTTNNGGTLFVSNSVGSGTGTGPVTINAGGAIGGSGTIGGSLTVNGGTLVANILGDSTCDTLKVAGAAGVTFSGTTSLNITSTTAYVPVVGNAWKILECTGAGAITGVLPAVPYGYNLQRRSTGKQLWLQRVPVGTFLTIR